MKINKILILSLIFILTINISVFAIDQVIYEESISASLFEWSLVGSSRVENTITNALPNDFGFTKMSTINVSRGSYRFYWYFNVPNLSAYNDNKYMVLEVANGFKTDFLNNNSTYLVFYDANGVILESLLISDKETNIVSININGVGFNFYQNYIILDFDDISSFTDDVSKVAVLQYFDSQQDVQVPTLVSDLKLSFYNNIDEVIISLQNKVDDLIKQNEELLNEVSSTNEKLEQIEDKLNQFIEAGPSQDVEESFNNENSKDKEAEESFKNLENSYFNDVESGLNNSIDYDTSRYFGFIEEVFANPTISAFFAYLYSNPFVSLAFLILPLFWMVYIIIYRG